MAKKIKHYEFKHSVKALPDQKVMALNYKCKPAIWESGLVTSTDVSVNRDGKLRNQYRILLDRRSPKDKALILYVGDDGIEQIDNG